MASLIFRRLFNRLIQVYLENGDGGDGMIYSRHRRSWCI